MGLAPSTIRNAAFRGVLKVEIVAPRVRGITREELDRYRAERLGKNWGARREGEIDEGRAAYYREYRARKKAGKTSENEVDEVGTRPAQDTAPSEARSVD